MIKPQVGLIQRHQSISKSHGGMIKPQVGLIQRHQSISKSHGGMIKLQVGLIQFQSAIAKPRISISLAFGQYAFARIQIN
jgi:hypothetical protein